MPSPQTTETHAQPSGRSLIDLILERVDRALAADVERIAPDRAGKAVTVKLARTAQARGDRVPKPARLHVKCSLCQRTAVISCFSCHKFYCSGCYIGYHDAAGQEVQ